MPDLYFLYQKYLTSSTPLHKIKASVQIKHVEMTFKKKNLRFSQN